MSLYTGAGADGVYVVVGMYGDGAKAAYTGEGKPYADTGVCNGDGDGEVVARAAAFEIAKDRGAPVIIVVAAAGAGVGAPTLAFFGPKITTPASMSKMPKTTASTIAVIVPALFGALIVVTTVFCGTPERSAIVGSLCVLRYLLALKCIVT